MKTKNLIHSLRSVSTLSKPRVLDGGLSNGLIYILIDHDLLESAKKSLSKTVRKILKEKPDLIQLRFKNLATIDANNKALEISKMVKKSPKTKLLINDRVDIAKASNAQGVHLGREDLPVKDARKILGKKAIIGKTAHNLSEIKEALKDGVDYISIGPVFRTALKPHLAPLGIAKVKRMLENSGIKNKTIPIFVIGGVNLKNACLLKKQGLSNVTVASDVILSKDPALRIRKFKNLLSN